MRIFERGLRAFGNGRFVFARRAVGREGEQGFRAENGFRKISVCPRVLDVLLAHRFCGIRN